MSVPTSPVLLSSVLDADELRDTQRAAAAYLDGEMAPPDVPGSLCSTHWLPIGPGSADQLIPAFQPRHALEAAVAAVAAAAIASRSPRLGSAVIVGLEWWLQEQWPGDLPKELHTDKAAWLEGDALMNAHPLVSSVLYLSDTGGPTAAFDARRAESGELQPRLPASVALAFPTPGALFLFDGDAVHCVCHPQPPLCAEPTEPQPRRTLLVNFWTRSPPGATDAPLPQLSCCPPWVAASAPRAALAPTLTVPTGTDFCADTTSWREQQVPPAIRDELLSVHRRGAPRLVLCAYDASQQGLDGLTGGADWTEELDRRRDVMAV